MQQWEFCYIRCYANAKAVTLSIIYYGPNGHNDKLQEYSEIEDGAKAYNDYIVKLLSLGWEPLPTGDPTFLALKHIYGT